MTALKGTCDYVLEPGDPQTWGGEKDERSYLGKRWECPHDAHSTVVEGNSERDLCLFHLPPDQKDHNEVVNAFLDAVSEARQSDDSEVSRRKQQFIGARVSNLDIGDLDIPVDQKSQLDFRHSRFTNGATFELTFDMLNEPDKTYHGAVSLSESLIDADVDFRGSTFDSNVLLWDLTVGGELDLSGISVDGDVVLAQSTIDGNLNLSGAVAETIFINNAGVNGSVKFDGLDAGSVNLHCTSVEDDVYMRGPESLRSGANFKKAKISGGLLISGKIAGETVIGDDLLLSNATVRGGFIVRGLTINGEVDFDGGLVEGAVDLHETTIVDGGTFQNLNFAEADIRGATIQEANFQRTDLTEADLSGADLRGSSLEQALLSRANLFNTDLRGAALYGTVFGDAQINDQTQFGEYSVYDYQIEGPTATFKEDSETSRLVKAASQYRTLEQLARVNAFPDKVSSYYVRRKETYHRQHIEEGDIVRRLSARVSRTLWLYGESWFRLMVTSAMVVVVFGGLYAMTGGIYVATQEPTHAFELPQIISVSAPQPVETLLVSVYFSVVTFTTLGFGDIQPTNSATQTLAGIESLIGAILIALLVSVFARRATR